jgi:hypothetical protein
MTLVEIEAIAGRPRGGSEIVTWDAWGHPSWYIDWGTEDSHLMSVVALENQTVVCVELFAANAAFRWIEPEFRGDFMRECLDKKIDPEDSGWGLWQDVEDPQAILVILAQIKGEL